MKKNLNCFVIGIMDLKDTGNVFDGKEVFLKASHLSNMNHSADMELIEEMVCSLLLDIDYSKIHEFCTSFLLAEAQGKMNEQILQEME
ncbi:hypothetical protein [Aliarcobacter butzleri]|uniref:hypothetical protein n=1 Tax=Aliarcobacter butzleri TaxID=28197 RepID=UPI0021B4E6A2|nr:hypothetical protein [Aliarcobacter butzleri]MCT7643883.1 hypothetical protein [Aliarcobacter butzleri]